MGGLAGRIRHHLRLHQRPHWHIDYLLPHGAPAAVIVGPTARRLECLVADALAQRFQVLRRFGSSDCRCPGHLFHGDEPRCIVAVALEALRGLGCEPREYYLSAAEPNDANASF
jgi:Uri superfamily endonuclease